ncbi:hypothetical protein EVAR_70638_1 [Eumeta japonica]|uniref:Uncharacterized protein n=1 Tax=Eumeta variegata TaxID=151549 RepID=A0A4C2A9L0_EUMVA|nr:hypothetical protein EVAR_70638_1 [Eumeta japonica]
MCHWEETLEDAAERLRMKKSEQELSLESIDFVLTLFYLKELLILETCAAGKLGVYDSGQQYENDCIICSSPSWWYFDETLEDAAERLRMKRKVNKNLV